VQIRRLELTRFRRFEHLTWHPRPGINCLVGPGDAGKTTLLEAIARATSPTPAGAASEHDYYRRRTEDGFEIELVLGALDEPLRAAFRPPALWGWRGPDAEMVQAPVDGIEPVMRLLVHGTPDLEVEHRLLLPNDEEVNFSADKRRLLGLCRVGEMRGGSREFRMARGSLLERTVGREEVRGAAARAVRDASTELELPDQVEERLGDLQEKLRREGVSSEELSLEVLSPPGQSLLGLLGLALGPSGEAIPLALSGQGAQRLASFVLASGLKAGAALIVMDEVEYGLEPYRRRLLVQRLRELATGRGQAFLTTHSSTVLAELEFDELLRVDVSDRDARPRVRAFAPALAKIARADAECLICRLPIVCEGTTEVELLRGLLPGFALKDGIDLDAVGIRFVDGGGQPQAFDVIRGFRDADFAVGVFLDEEREHRGRRKQARADDRISVGRFRNVASTEEALARNLPTERLDELLEVSGGSFPRIAESRRRQLNHHLGMEGDRSPSTLVANEGEERVRSAIAEAAHKCDWFKARPDAKALAAWLGDGRLPAPMAEDLASFYGAIRPLLWPIRKAPANAEQRA
jgi:putative ATP-dependent endonuclease of OLD family